MTTGWIKLHRSILQWEWWDDINTSRLWLTILLHVNHETKQWKGQEIKAGEMVTSYRKLAHLSGLSERSVRTSLTRLQATHEVTCESTHDRTTIRVVKWADFQGLDEQTDTPTDRVTHQKSTTNKNKEDKNIRNKNIFRKPSIEEIRSYIAEKGLNVDADYFYDYYESNGWTVGKSHMKSWQSTLNNWNRREKKKPSDHVVIDKPSYMGTGYDPEAFKW